MQKKIEGVNINCNTKIVENRIKQHLIKLIDNK
jgi:hypothetical protein